MSKIKSLIKNHDFDIVYIIENIEFNYSRKFISLYLFYRLLMLNLLQKNFRHIFALGTIFVYS